jgi:hypothetical protein
MVISPAWGNDPAAQRLTALISIVKAEAARVGAAYLDIAEPRADILPAHRWMQARPWPSPWRHGPHRSDAILDTDDGMPRRISRGICPKAARFRLPFARGVLWRLARSSARSALWSG